MWRTVPSGSVTVSTYSYSGISNTGDNISYSNPGIGFPSVSLISPFGFSTDGVGVVTLAYTFTVSPSTVVVDSTSLYPGISLFGYVPSSVGNPGIGWPASSM